VDAAIIVVFIVVVVGGLIMMAVSAATAERRRSEELSAWARTEGLTYEVERPELARRFSGTPFESGVDAKATHVLSGRWRGRSVTVYEYYYMTNTGNGQTMHKFTIVAVATDTTPVLQVRGKHLGHRLLDLVGVGDLELGDEEFDALFHVRSDDTAFARAFLDDETRGWLRSNLDAVPFRLTGDHLILWGNRTLAPDGIRSHLGVAVGLAERVAGHAGEPDGG
jgi:hypothetical protein